MSEERYGYTVMELKNRLKVFKPETPVIISGFRIGDFRITKVEPVYLEKRNKYSNLKYTETQIALCHNKSKKEYSPSLIVFSVGELLEKLSEYNENYKVLVNISEGSDDTIYNPRYVGIGINRGEPETVFAVICGEVDELDVREAYIDEEEEDYE